MCNIALESLAKKHPGSILILGFDPKAIEFDPKKKKGKKLTNTLRIYEIILKTIYEKRKEKSN